MLPELVNRYLAVPDPVVLWYTINPGILPPDRAQAWDVELKMEDTAIKSRMNAMLQSSKETSGTLHKLDEEVSLFCLEPRDGMLMGLPDRPLGAVTA